MGVVMRMSEFFLDPPLAIKLFFQSRCLRSLYPLYNRHFGNSEEMDRDKFSVQDW